MDQTNVPVAALPLELEEEVIHWLDRFHNERWSGSLTLHFNKGMVQSYEPKPNLRIVT